MTCSTSASAGRAPSSFKASHLDGDVVGRPADEEPQKRQTLLLVEPAGDAVVDQGDAAVALDEEVASVQVAVEDPVQQGALEEGDHLGPEHGRRVDPGRPHPLDVVPCEAVEPLHHEHPRGVTSRGWGRGTMMARWLVSARTRPTSSMFSASRRKSSSSTIVSANSSISAGGLASADDRDPPDEERGEEAHDGEVLAHELGDVGTLHLDDHLLAGAEPGAVDLGDRGGGDRGLGRTRRRSLRAARGARPRRCGAHRRMTPAGRGRAAGGIRETISSGKIPSPEERIWPSLM